MRLERVFERSSEVRDQKGVREALLKELMEMSKKMPDRICECLLRGTEKRRGITLYGENGRGRIYRT
jgi:hypothetical protein